MKLYVIRHGQTSWNVEGRIQGQVDIDLNENGVELARRTASGIKDLPIDLIITSPFARAKNTALLATAGRDIPIIEDVRLSEMAFGEWEGQYNDNRDHVLCDDFLKTLREDIFSLNPPGGENVRDVIRRTGDFLKELGEDPSLADSNIPRDRFKSTFVQFQRRSEQPQFLDHQRAPQLFHNHGGLHQWQGQDPGVR